MLVSGASNRDIAERFGASKSAVFRHREHVGAALIRAAGRKGERFDETLLQKAGRLEDEYKRLGERAEAADDLRGALVANHGLLDVIRLLHELTPTTSSSAQPRLVEEIRAAAEIVRAGRAENLVKLRAELKVEIRAEMERERLPELRSAPDDEKGDA